MLVKLLGHPYIYMINIPNEFQFMKSVFIRNTNGELFSDARFYYLFHGLLIILKIL